jgi:hypothetical protein
MELTSERARELGAKANKIRWDKWRAARAAELLPKPPIQPIPQNTPVPPQIPSIQSYDPFVRETLNCMRDRMRELLKAMRGAPAGIDKFAAALGKLAEIERQLAGRPMPGSLKPAQPKSTRSSAFVTSGAPEPEPAADLIPPSDIYPLAAGG